MAGGVTTHSGSDERLAQQVTPPPRQPFAFGVHVAVEATGSDLPAIAAFYAESPEYLRGVEGREPGPADAAEFVHDAPPSGFAYTTAFNLLLRDTGGRIDGLMGVATDLPTAGVWHLGLLIVATRLHGSGFAQAALAAYEGWARAAGAQWLRLGVVAQNARAIRFWQRQGYLELRRREGIAMGALSNTVILMMKPLTARPLADYLARVPRDRPDVA